MNKVLREYQDPYEFDWRPEVRDAPANKLEYGIGPVIVFQSERRLRTVKGTPFMIKWQNPNRLDFYANKFKEASGKDAKSFAFPVTSPPLPSAPIPISIVLSTIKIKPPV